MDREALKHAIKTSALVRLCMLSVVIPGVRGYLRYAGTPFGKETLFCSVVGTHFYGLEPKKWEFTANTIFGSRICSSANDTLGRLVYFFGVWEPNLTSWISGRLAPGDVFIDVGANIGYHTLLASKLVGNSGKVISIEALPPIFSILRRHLQVNGVGNVRAVNSAAWDCEDVLTFYTGSDELTVTTTAMPSWAAEWRLESRSQVSAAPLSSILRPEEIQAARLIKIDVEGAEWHVLSGMSPVMDSCRDDVEIMVEITPSALAAEGRSSEDVLNFFRKRKFHPYRLDEPLTAYLGRDSSRPKRIEVIPPSQTDVIFSRIDAGSL